MMKNPDERIADLYDQLKSTARDLCEQSVSLATYLDRQSEETASQQEGDTSRQEEKLKGYIEYTLAYAKGFKVILSNANLHQASAATVRNFAAQLDGYLNMSRSPHEQMVKASKGDQTVVEVADRLIQLREAATRLVQEAYDITNVQSAPAPLQEQEELPELFWLKIPQTSQETITLSEKLLLGPLDDQDQKTLINFTVEKLLNDWENATKVIEDSVDGVVTSGDQQGITTLVSELILMHDELRTLYNNLVITVQRLEQSISV